MEADNKNLAVVIMAAGKGTRMNSDLAKVLHQAGGKPLLSHVIALAKALKANPIVVVVGHQAKRVREAFASEPGLSFALQEPQLGTGHAVMAAAPKLAGHQGPVLILSGDVPALSLDTLNNLLEVHLDQKNQLTVLAMDLDDPGHYGRMITGPDGDLRLIVEFRDASPEQKKISLVNAGIYMAQAGPLLEYLPKLNTQNDQGEYYLTDLVALMSADGLKVGHAICPDPRQVAGVNSPEQLAAMDAHLRSRTDQM